MNDMLKINARDCDVRDVDSISELDFLEENHIQGYVNSIVAYGLFYNNKLVQLMSFGKPRFNKYYQWDLIRDCTKKDYIVNGGVSKLWNYFIKINNPIDVICYSYPHNEELYTSKYVDHCGFKNISKAKPANKIYFEGMWNGKKKRIDKSLLETHGVDRLLKGSFGQDRTNEQILLDLGFEKKYEDGLSPQTDSWFRGGCVYKMEIIGTDKFYIGKTMADLKDYWGSGTDWNKFLDENNIPRDDGHINKIVLKDDGFISHKDLYDQELKYISEYCYKETDGRLYKLPEYRNSMLNRILDSQWIGDLAECPECGVRRARHKKTCSRYTPYKPCEECGALLGHKKLCSKYKEPEKCKECGAIVGHKSTCSQYKPDTPCPECGSTGRHKKTCSKSQWHKNICQECGLSNGRHKLSCSKFNTKNICSECGGINNQHKKICSKFKHNKACPECGSLTTHKSTCSKYKSSSVCSECGGKRGHHTNTCIKFVSHYKCSECGLIGKHSKDCSYNKCEECGNPIKSHKSTCSKYKKLICSECGGKNNVHKKECSQYKEHKLAKSCPECGSVRSHKSTCSKYKRKPCNECGVISGRHKKGCSKYKKSIVCSKCGGRNGHHYKICTLK